MKIYLAGDHAGFALKQALLAHIPMLGEYDVEDVGAFALDEDDDYPDFITPCAKLVAADPESRGIIIGGSGNGEAMAANRISGVRAAVFYGPVHAPAGLDREGNVAADEYDIVRLARKHNDANILSLGSRFVSGETALEAVRLFLTEPFSDSPRHARRLGKF
jgi:ribose 5-phosphate isomerase B